jgi:hypothetical protein
VVSTQKTLSLRAGEKWQPQGHCSGPAIVLADLFLLHNDLFKPTGLRQRTGKKGWRKQSGKWKSARAPKWKRDARKPAAAEAAEAQLLAAEDTSLSVNPVCEEEGLAEEWVTADNENIHAG